MTKEELINLAHNLHFQVELDLTTGVERKALTPIKPFIRFRHTLAPGSKDHSVVIFEEDFQNDTDLYHRFETALIEVGSYLHRQQIKTILGI